MGDLKGKEIVQSRIWLDPNLEPLPSYDYKYSYPITVYDAVKQTMEDNSPTLTEEMQAIYRLINSKQDIIEAGKPAWVMTWTGIRGNIGEMEVVKNINRDPLLRSHNRLVSEKAILDALDGKVSLEDFNEHVNNDNIHITDYERTKWNSMAPLSTLQAHMHNKEVHITDVERGNWNNKANQVDLENHIYDTNNPHNTTAHQVGTYTRREIDDMFKEIRESFFNYLNIYWDDRNIQAKLDEYDPANWNPNFVLDFGDDLPDVENTTELIYFALKPATDYHSEETQDCIIYIKRPGMAWTEVGMQTMNVGDMVIKFPDTTMYVWVQGRFIKLFTGATDAEGVEGTNTKMWRPSVSEEGLLSWELSDSKDVPEPVDIKGKDGYTPIKGVDYDDGKDGEGVAPGGLTGELLIKQTDENFDTTWKSLMSMLEDFVVEGTTLPENLVEWNKIKNRPNWYDELGDHSDGFITQRAATRQFEITGQNIADIQEKLLGLDALKDEVFDHIHDYNNPHRVTPNIIGAVSMATFTDHVTNFENPHNVTAEQIGLGNVNNTSDMDKPISNATQEALDDLLKKIQNMSVDFDDLKCIENVVWDDHRVVLTFIYKDGSELDVHIPITEIFESIYYDEAEKELVIVLPDGTEHRIDVSKMIQQYFGSDSQNIHVTVDENTNVIAATIIPDSVTGEELVYSIHLKGSPTTTTQPVNDRSTRIATTEFVKQTVIDNLISYETDRPLSANMGRVLNTRKADIEDVIQIINDLEGLDVIDNLDSTNPLAALSANMGRHLDLIKAPRVHTSPEGSTFGRATISLFGHTRASEVDPLMDGTVFKGTDDGRYARADHRHPTDITRAPIHFPDVEHNQYKLTGEPKADTPPDASNDERIATTEWVRRNAVGVSKGYCSTETTNPYKTVELRSTFCDPPFLLLQIGSAISVTFRFEDRSGETPTMLNVNGTGWHPVLFGGVPLTDGMLAAFHEHLFVFEGTYFRLINPRPGTGYGTIVLGPGKPAEINGNYMNKRKDIMSGNVVDDFTEENHQDGENGGTYTNDFFDGQEPEDLHEEYDPWNAGGGSVAGGGYITGSKGEDGSYTINQVSGITGYTCKGDGPDANAHGEVKCVYFTIPYESRRSNVAIEFPSSLTDSDVIDNEDNQPMSLFGAKMGDGTIIDLDTPVVKSTGDSSAIIQFTLAKVYACNSPCELIYRTNKAWIKITEVPDKSVNPVEEKKEESEESDD